MEKIYAKPMFKLVKQRESNKLFFVASGTQEAPKFSGGKLNSITKTTGTW